MNTFLHISSKYGRGGVGNSVKRLHFNLIKNNYNSIIINSSESDVKNNVFKLNNIFNLLLLKIKYRVINFFRIFKKGYSYNNYTNFFSISSEKIISLFNHKVDYIILHSVQNYCSYKSIYKLKNYYNAKVYLYIYDCEFFTGGCHYNLKCEKYLSDCSDCNAISIKNKKSAIKLFKYKKKYFQMINPEIISNSNYLRNKSIKSNLLSSYNNFVLPVTIDKNSFFRTKTSHYNSLKIRLLYATPNLDNQVKGFNNLLYILKKLDKNILIRFELITLGNSKNLNKINFLKHKHIDFVKTDNELLEIYNKSDFFIMTSTIEESNSTMLMEAMFCGMPYISFNVGNVKYFKNKNTGFIIENNNFIEYIKSLNNLVNLSKNEYKLMSDQCITESEKNFGLSKNFNEIKNNIINNI